MIKTACSNRMNFDEIAATLRRQHPRIQDHDAGKSHDRQPERRTFKPWQDREQPKPAGFQPRKSWKPPFKPGLRRSAYSMQGGDETESDQDDASDEAEPSVVSTKDYQDDEDQIEQGIVMRFPGVQDGLDARSSAKINGYFHDEVYAFYSREQARSNGVNVGKHIHAYKPRSELSVEERREKVNLAKKKLYMPSMRQARTLGRRRWMRAPWQTTEVWRPASAAPFCRTAAATEESIPARRYDRSGLPHGRR